MRPVTHPIHQSQRCIIQDVFGKMIFQQHERTADPRRLLKQVDRILGVVENVHEKANVDGSVQKRERGSVKYPAFDLALRPYKEFDTLNRNVRTKPLDQTANGAVPTTNIQHGCALGNLFCQRLSQHSGAALKYESVMPALDPGEWQRNRPGCLRWASHLFQVVVTDECFPANAQHAQKESGENNLQSKEQ